VSSPTELVFLDLHDCPVMDEGLQTLSSLTTLTDLYITGCFQVTAAAKQALRTAIPNLTICGRMKTLPPSYSYCHATLSSVTVYSALRGGPPSRVTPAAIPQCWRFGKGHDAESANRLHHNVLIRPPSTPHQLASVDVSACRAASLPLHGSCSRSGHGERTRCREGVSRTCGCAHMRVEHGVHGA
jgi:hypothetical protein